MHNIISLSSIQIKRLSEEVLNEINEMIIEYNTPKDDQVDQDDDDDHSNGGGEQEPNEQQDVQSPTKTAGNSGTLILDATCAPQNIKYPQDMPTVKQALLKLSDSFANTTTSK